MSNTVGETRGARRARHVLAALFVTAGVAHFIAPEFFVEIVPPMLPDPPLLVALSGVAEILGGIGLLVPRMRRAAAVGLILLLVAVFPANVQMLRNWLAKGGGGWYELLLWIRLPLQPLLVWWVARVGLSRSRSEARAPTTP